MASDISKLSVILTANSAGFAGGLKGGEAALASFESKASGLTGSLGGLGSSIAGFAAAAGGIALVFGGIKAAFQDFVESENAVAQLNARLKSTGGAAGFSSEQLQRMAGDLQQIGAISDGAALNAEAVMLSFTNIKGDNFKQALVAAMDLSAGLGEDLQTAVIQVGKALNDPAEGLTSLKRIGVAFTEQQREQIRVMQEAGDVMGAQKLILKELATEFGGSAAAKAKQLEGQITLATEALKDIGKEIFAVAAPALKELAGAVKRVGDFFREHQGAVKAFAEVALQGLTAVGKVAKFVFGGTGDAAANAQKDLDSITATIPKTGDAAAEAGKKIADLAKHVADTTERLKEEVATFGMSKSAAELYKLGMQGATDAQLQQAAALAKQLDGMDAQKKAWDELTAAAKKYTEEVKSPAEKVSEEINKIAELQRKGILKADVAAKAADKVAGDFAKSQHFKNPKPADFGRNFAGDKTPALERRFTAGFPAEQTDATKKMLAVQQDMRKAAQETAKNTRRLADSRDKIVTIGA